MTPVARVAIPNEAELDIVIETVARIRRSRYADAELNGEEREALALWNSRYETFARARTAGVPRRLWAATFDWSTPTPFLDRARTFVADGLPRRALVLAGPTGVGKSWAAAAVLHHAGTGRFLHVPALARALVAYATQAKTMAQLTRDRFLVLDDLGADLERSDGLPFVLWDEVIATRHARQLPTLFTTNLTRDGLKQRLGDRAWDRLTDRAWGEVFASTGASRRQQETRL
jgi:DNA replication protein DnaC